ncbi:MAG: ligase-associated DNA damage response endonuclease PdeM [Flavobacteriales bacterium]|nr:ligase-associated DNA damage response endonuclease PdeM [Flavobacteriales bacterium]
MESPDLDRSVATFSFLGQEFLLEDRALFWVEHRTLLIADVHLGKASHFNRSGVPVPHSIEDKNLHRCEELIRTFVPEQVVFMGDLFHAESNPANELFKDWVGRFTDVRFILIEGNHDRWNARLGRDIEVSARLELGNITLVHEPLDPEIRHICGHVHPAVGLRGKGRQYVKVPACIIENNRLIMPAFGEFTGMHRIKMQRHMQAIPCL